MRKILLKIIIVWCLKMASAAPIEGHNRRAARQWVLYGDSVPYASIYPDQQVPLPYLYPYYNAPELNLQLTGLYPYNQITYHNQPLHYLPNILPDTLKPSVQIIDKGSKISTILKSKLKIAQKLFGIFGIKTQKKQHLKPNIGAQSNLIPDYNTVSILPERLGCFLAKLKEESLQRSEGIPEQKAEGQKKGTLDSVKGKVDLENNLFISNNDLVSSQQLRSNVDATDQMTYEASEKMTKEIKALSNDEIRDLIGFFDTVSEIYGKSGPHSPTDTIEIKIMSGQPKDITESENENKENGDGKSNLAVIDCDVNSSEELEGDKILMKSPKCELVMTVTMTHQPTEQIRNIVEISAATESILELKDYISKEDTETLDVTSESDRNFSELWVIEKESENSASLEAPRELVVTPRNLLFSSVLNESINESTIKLNGSTTTSVEDRYSTEDNFTNASEDEYKNDDQEASEDNQQSSVTVEQEQSESPVSPLH